MKSVTSRGLFAKVATLFRNRSAAKPRRYRPFTSRPCIESLEDRNLLSAGTLYVGNYAGSTVSAVSETGVVSAYANSGGSPTGLAFDGSGNLFAGNSFSGTVTEIAPGGASSTIFASGFNRPEGLAFDGIGNLYVANYGDGTVSEVSPSAVVSTFAFVAGGIGGLAFDHSGNLFVSGGNGNNAVFEVTPSGTVSTFVTNGGLDRPFGLAFDSLGNLYAANQGGGGSVSKITPGGVVSTFASGGLLTGTPNGDYGVLVDASDDVFVSNYNGGTILKITPGGVVSGFADGLNGPAYLLAEAQIVAPSSLSGTVFVDFNDDGQVDFSEAGIAGVTITLSGTDDLVHAVNLSQPTDSAGTYVFPSLRPGTYTIGETQPSGYSQGKNSVGTGGGTVSGDQFTVSVAAGEDAMNYNYGERPAATGAVHSGQTAGIGFWNNKNGQALIKALNVGGTQGTSTQLGNWLADTFPNMFGASSGSSNLHGKTNGDVASFFQGQFVVHGQKLDAQVLATALSVYVTDGTLDNTGVGTQYGFVVGGNGVATATFNVGANGDAFGVANNTVMTVLDFLLAADGLAVNGVLYNGNTAKRNMATNVFSAINQAGGI